MRMGSNFGTQNALDKKIQKAAGGKEVFPRKVSAQNPAKKGPAKIVIIGGGACGMSAATQIRRQSDFEITVLSRDSHTAYSPCGIPFVLSREIDSFEKLIVKPLDFYRENRIDVKLNENVKSINTSLRIVRTGKGIYPFDKLVIATGSLPFIPQTSCTTNILPYGIFTLRSLADGVLFESGVKPEIILALEAGIEIGKAGGIVVNEMLQVKAGEEFLPYVYAGGGCVEVTDFITGESRLSQLGTTAKRMAEIIGDNITGKQITFGSIIDPWVSLAGDLQFGGVGITSRKAESNGINLVTGFSSGCTRASYYPGKKDLYIKLLFKDDYLVGAQLVGGEGIKERIDALSLAIRKKATIKDLLDLETSYAPPVSMLVDPLRPAVKAAIQNMGEREDIKTQ